MKKLAAILLAGTLLPLAACEQPDLEDARPMHEAPDPEIPAPTTLNLFHVTGTAPDSTAGDALEWAIEQLNLGHTFSTVEEVAAQFEPSVLETASAAAIRDQIGLVGRDRPYAFVGYTSEPTPTAIEALVMSRNGFRTVKVETAESGRLTVLLFERAVVPFPEGNVGPEDWDPSVANAAPAAAVAPAPTDGSGEAADAPEGDALPAVDDVTAGTVPADE